MDHIDMGKDWKINSAEVKEKLVLESSLAFVDECVSMLMFDRGYTCTTSLTFAVDLSILHTKETLTNEV